MPVSDVPPVTCSPLAVPLDRYSYDVGGGGGGGQRHSATCCCRQVASGRARRRRSFLTPAMTTSVKVILVMAAIYSLTPIGVLPGLLPGVDGSIEEERLVKSLFRTYNKLIRPVSNLSDYINVQFDVALIQIVDIDEKNQVLKTNVWLRFVWKDHQLGWDPADYDGIKVIRVSRDTVWVPDIVLMNNADGKYEVSFHCNVLVFANGDCNWIPPAIYKSSCKIDVRYFPFDEQTCTMLFKSWTYNAEQLKIDWYKLDRQGIGMADYIISGTWDIIDVPGVLSHDRSNITYYVIIRRKTLFYTVNLIIPAVLISFLSILVFYLPAGAGEKMSLGISILLALIVFFLLVSKILPATSLSIPLIAKYLLFAFIMNIITIFVTVIIINVNFRGPTSHYMPKWSRVIFLEILPKILMIKRPVPPWRKKTERVRGGPLTIDRAKQRYQQHLERQRQQQQQQSAGDEPSKLQLMMDVDAIRGMEELDEIDLHHPNCAVGRQQQQRRTLGGGSSQQHIYDVPPPDDTTDDVIVLSREDLPDNKPPLLLGRTNTSSADSGMSWMDLPDVRRCINSVAFIAEHFKSSDDDAEIEEDWKYMAMVIDRLQLYLFFIITVTGSLSIIMDAPHIFEHYDETERIHELSQVS